MDLLYRVRTIHWATIFWVGYFALVVSALLAPPEWSLGLTVAAFAPFVLMAGILTIMLSVLLPVEVFKWAKRCISCWVLKRDQGQKPPL